MFVLERESFARALTALMPHAAADSGVVESAATITADDDGTITISTGSPTRGACIACPGRAVIAGELAIPVAPVTRVLQKSSGARVEIATHKSSVALVIDAESLAPRQYTFDQVSTPESPTPPAVASGTAVVRLAADEFRALVAQTAFAATRRPDTTHGWATNALELHLEDNRLSVAATDLFRLATAHRPVDANPKRASATGLVSAASAKAWAKASRKAEVVSLTFGDGAGDTGGAVMFRAGPLLAWDTYDADGQFPRWRGSADLALPHELTVPVGPLRSGLASALAINEWNTEAAVILTTKKGCLVVASAPSGGSGARSEATVPLPTFTGPYASIRIDARRLLHTLRAYRDSPTVTVSFSAEGGLVAVRDGDSSCYHVRQIERVALARPRGSTTHSSC